MRGLIRRLLGPPAERTATPERIPDDVASIIERVRPYSMTSTERIWALVEAVRYAVRARVPGAFAECGVWRGGSVMAMLLALERLGVLDRDVYLYDTFSGMTPPTTVDTTDFGEPAVETWAKATREDHPWRKAFDPALQSEEAVRRTLLGTGYPGERLHFVAGPVESTLPAASPPRLALLRLDTDWYESTRHELEHLYPRLAPGGILVIDDYGHWRGCRKAVDEYFSRPDVRPILLQRIDYTARLGIKV